MIEHPCPNCPQCAQTGECVGSEGKNYIDFEVLKTQIMKVLATLYDQDIDLIERQVNERSITAKFARHYENLYGADYPRYHFDVEYQRNGVKSKYYSVDKYACPDFIVHRRNCNKHNLIMIEFKPHWATEQSHANDIEKLKAFTSPEKLFDKGGKPWCYNYIYGVHIILCQSRAPISFFRNGEAEPFDTDCFVKEAVPRG